MVDTVVDTGVDAVVDTSVPLQGLSMHLLLD